MPAASSFELSVGQHRLVVNCGLPATSRRAGGRSRARTAAHSTVTLQRLLVEPLPRRQTVARVWWARRSSAGHPGSGRARGPRGRRSCCAPRHDGYADRFGIIHQRSLRLAADGSRLDGEDSFLPVRGDSCRPATPTFAVRFHLHPSVKASRLSRRAQRRAVVAQPGSVEFHRPRGPWSSSRRACYLASRDGPRRTVQIVIHGRARK